MARGIYYQMDTPQTNALDPEIRSVGISSGAIQPKVEPTIMEHLAAYTYALIGTGMAKCRQIIFHSFLGDWWDSIIFTCQTVDLHSMVHLLLWRFTYLYLLAFLPAVHFQPDPLMVMCMMWALYFQYKWSETPSTRNAILAGLFTGLAIFVKATSAYFVGLPLAWFCFDKGIQELGQRLAHLPDGCLALLPAILFNVISATVGGNEGSIFGSRFFPSLLSIPNGIFDGS